MAHNRESTSLFRFIVPTARDHIPNGVLQPLILTWVRWAWWSHTASNTLGDRVVVTVIVWQDPREDLIDNGAIVSSSKMMAHNGGTHPE